MFQRSGPFLVRWHWRTHACLILILLATLSVPVSQAAATLQDDTVFAPASENAQVIAQGVVVLPGDELVWRTVRYSAAPESESDFAAWPLGFVLAITDPLLLTDQQTGDQLRLGPGEAALVRDGTIQRRTNLGAAAAAYLALELVPAAQADGSGTGTVLQTWPAGVAGPGPRDIDLVRSVLTSDDLTQLPDTGQTNLLLVTEGSLVAAPPGEEGQSLLAGESLAFDGDLETRIPTDDVDAARDGPHSVFVAAIIGPLVPVSSTPEVGERSTGGPTGPLARAPVGSISVQVFACPSGMSPDTLDQDECAAASEDFDFILSSDALDMILTLADAVAGESIYTWERLPYGDYRVTEVVLPPGYDTYLLTAEKPIDGGPAAGYIVTLDETSPDILLSVYNFAGS